ncbi:MAG: flagellar hook-length control protein FliK [Paracoccus sp. (in: a-proteobacteria)]|uniref:flagellar hook-length control protein FliK n=1 Tax=Paracoccus sp. TaxID=267 RepID=UPI0026E0EE35|nr:flagellar hook-length control protein FliK [Paracoccus sp. (in: a-proteobacteria)]MDO5620877.1 flagellar hook-length control protein FliK [Paracoccus sp. (in: a-proteobacteria)]
MSEDDFLAAFSVTDDSPAEGGSVVDPGAEADGQADNADLVDQAADSESEPLGLDAVPPEAGDHGDESLAAQWAKPATAGPEVERVTPDMTRSEGADSPAAVPWGAASARAGDIAATPQIWMPPERREDAVGKMLPVDNVKMAPVFGAELTTLSDVETKENHESTGRLGVVPVAVGADQEGSADSPLEVVWTPAPQAPLALEVPQPERFEPPAESVVRAVPQEAYSEAVITQANLGVLDSMDALRTLAQPMLPVLAERVDFDPKHHRPPDLPSEGQAVMVAESRISAGLPRHEGEGAQDRVPLEAVRVLQETALAPSKRYDVEAIRKPETGAAVVRDSQPAFVASPPYRQMQMVKAMPVEKAEMLLPPAEQGGVRSDIRLEQETTRVVMPIERFEVVPQPQSNTDPRVQTLRDLGASAPVVDFGDDRRFVAEMRTAVEGATPSPRQATPLVQQLVQAVSNVRTGEVELRLSPEELGAVKLSIRPEQDVTRVVIWAERPDVMQHLRRNADLLLQDLRDQGLPSPELDFGNDQGQRQPEAQPGGRVYVQQNKGDEAAPVIEMRPQAYQGGPLDIRI